MDLGSPSSILIKPNEEKTEFQFLLSFPERLQPVEFSISTDGAMVLMAALQRLQVKHKIPIPKSVRPGGKPMLRVVSDDE